MTAITRAVIAGGKTGGHLYPGIAVAEEILARNPTATVSFIGTAHGIEARVLPPLGYPLDLISASRLKGSGLMGRLLGVARVPVAMVQSWRVLCRRRPQVVLGVGGYASGPALLAAWLLRYPTAIQEQNAHAGLTNRLLGRVVGVIYLGFEAARAQFGSRATVTTGNPIRRALVDALAAATEAEAATEATPRSAAGSAESTPGSSLHVLVFGGSQGARFLNERVPPALTALADAHPDLSLTVTHQTGLHDEAATRARYESALPALSGRVTVTPFIDDMPSAYAAADVAICRAGALTIAELTAVGLPALLVPFPFAADNHQEVNARVLAEAGAGEVLTQAEWTRERALAWLGAVAGDRAHRSAMSARARELARPEAARTLVDHLEGLAA